MPWRLRGFGPPQLCVREAVLWGGLSAHRCWAPSEATALTRGATLEDSWPQAWRAEGGGGRGAPGVLKGLLMCTNPGLSGAAGLLAQQQEPERGAWAGALPTPPRLHARPPAWAAGRGAGARETEAPRRAGRSWGVAGLGRVAALRLRCSSQAEGRGPLTCRQAGPLWSVTPAFRRPWPGPRASLGI